MKHNLIDSQRNALIEELDAPPLDPIVLGVANRYLGGDSISAIAHSYDISPDIVSQILDKKEVKAYVDNVYLNQGFLNRHKRVELINQVIEQKIQEALETQVFSKKDLLDWLKILNDMESAAKPKPSGPSVAVQVNNNYDNLMKDLLKKE